MHDEHRPSLRRARSSELTTHRAVLRARGEALSEGISYVTACRAALVLRRRALSRLRDQLNLTVSRPTK